MSSPIRHAPASETRIGTARRFTATKSRRPLRNICRIAAVAQLVERELPKLEVAGSTPVRRFAGIRISKPFALSAGRMTGSLTDSPLASEA